MVSRLCPGSKVINVTKEDSHPQLRMLAADTRDLHWNSSGCVLIYLTFLGVAKCVLLCDRALRVINQIPSCGVLPDNARQNKYPFNNSPQAPHAERQEGGYDL